MKTRPSMREAPYPRTRARGASEEEEGGERMWRPAAIQMSRKEVGAAVPMASSKGGRRGVAARLGQSEGGR